jgi:hypothetical protein
MVNVWTDDTWVRLPNGARMSRRAFLETRCEQVPQPTFGWEPGDPDAPMFYEQYRAAGHPLQGEIDTLAEQVDDLRRRFNASFAFRRLAYDIERGNLGKPTRALDDIPRPIEIGVVEE